MPSFIKYKRENDKKNTKYQAIVLFAGLLAAVLPAQAQTAASPVGELRKQIAAPWQAND